MTGVPHPEPSTGSAPTTPPSTVPVEAPAGLRLDTSVPHPARRYNYWCGGKDHFAADRASGDAIASRFPGVIAAARENRAFLHRAVAHLARAGVDQFLDIGAGIPLTPNTHDIAQGVAPHSRVVYVDNDPMVLAHARALLTSGPHGATAVVDGDLRTPAPMLHDVQLQAILDFDRPVGLLLVAVLHFLTDDEATHAATELIGALAPGSYVVLSHGTSDLMTDTAAAELPALQQHDPTQYRPRSGTDIARYVTGLYVVNPATVQAGHTAAPAATGSDAAPLVSVARWLRDPDDEPPPADEEVACYGVVAGTHQPNVLPAQPTPQ